MNTGPTPKSASKPTPKSSSKPTPKSNPRPSPKKTNSSDPYHLFIQTQIAKLKSETPNLTSDSYYKTACTLWKISEENPRTFNESRLALIGDDLNKLRSFNKFDHQIFTLESLANVIIYPLIERRDQEAKNLIFHIGLNLILRTDEECEKVFKAIIKIGSDHFFKFSALFKRNHVMNSFIKSGLSWDVLDTLYIQNLVDFTGRGLDPASKIMDYLMKNCGFMTSKVNVETITKLLSYGKPDTISTMFENIALIPNPTLPGPKQEIIDNMKSVIKGKWHLTTDQKLELCYEMFETMNGLVIAQN